VFWSELANPEEAGQEATETELVWLAELTEFEPDPAAHRSEARLNPQPQKEQRNGYSIKEA
jgi:hypothetical protein